MVEFCMRLQEALARSGMSQSELCEQTGIPKSAMSQYISGAFKPKQARTYLLARALNVSEAWLMGYDVATESAIPPGFDPLPEMQRVPIVGSIACGVPILAEENLEGYCSVPDEWHADFCLTCKGDSMEPIFHDGDIVAVRKQPVVENGEIAAVRIDNEATLKRVYRSGDMLTLRPENGAYAPITLVRDEINTCAIEGRAVGLCRGV